MKRIYVNVTDQQYATLKWHAEFNGSSIAEGIRRLVAESISPKAHLDRLRKVYEEALPGMQRDAARGSLEAQSWIEDGKRVITQLENECA
jgi:hypothetical protein